jgi:hypothetical protein
VLDTQPSFTQAVSQVPSDESSEPEDNEGTEPEQPEVPEELLSNRDVEVDKQDDEQPSVESDWFLDPHTNWRAGPASSSLAGQVFRKGL